MSACEESFLRLIALTSQAMRSYADQRLKGFDLTVEQFQVLKQMTKGVGQPQSMLCEVSGKSAANITRILDRLEKKNRIVRKPNEEDRRSSLVFLTDEGEKLRAEVLNLFEVLRSELFLGMSDEKLFAALDVLLAIKTNIDRLTVK